MVDWVLDIYQDSVLVILSLALVVPTLAMILALHRLWFQGWSETDSDSGHNSSTFYLEAFSGPGSDSGAKSILGPVLVLVMILAWIQFC